MTRKRTARLIGLGALLCASFFSGCTGEEQTAAPAPPKTISIKVVHGSELAEYMESVKSDFNRSNERLPDGTLIKLELIQESGFAAAAKIATGSVKPDAWLAQSTSDIDYVNTHIRHLGAKQSDCKVLFRTPVVFGIYEGDLEYFKGQTDPNSFEEMLSMDFGGKVSLFPVKRDISFTYPHPFQAATGPLGIIQLGYMAVSPDRTALAAQKLAFEGTVMKLLRYEREVSMQMPDELFAMRRAAYSQSKKLRFAITTEQTVAKYNMVRNPEVEARALAVYPREGSYWNEYQLCASEADWVTPQKKAAIANLLTFLSGETYQIRAKRNGFRPAIVPGPETEPLMPKFGVNLSAPAVSLPPISGKTYEHLVANWNRLQPPQAVVMVLDKSGSMQGNTLATVKKLFQDFGGRKRKEDLIALLTNSTEPELALDFTADSNAFAEAVGKIESIGGSALYDSIKLGLEMLAHDSRNDFRKYLVFVTDGEDKNSRTSFKEAVAYVRGLLVDEDIRMYIGGISNVNEDFADMKVLAEASFGHFEEHSIGNLPGYMEQIAENFWGPKDLPR